MNQGVYILVSEEICYYKADDYIEKVVIIELKWDKSKVSYCNYYPIKTERVNNEEHF